MLFTRFDSAHLCSQITLILLRLQLRTIIKAVRVSPQQRENWFNELRAVLQRSQGSTEASQDHSQASQAASDGGGSAAQATSERMKILILDVRTRWSSTHAMLGVFAVALMCWFTDILLNRARA
jgi:hypothetical protein